MSTWSFGDGDTRGDYTLSFSFTQPIDNAEFVALSEAHLIELSARYATAQPRLLLEPTPKIEYVRRETTRMIPMDLVIDRTIQRDRVFQSDDVTVETAYQLGFFKFPAPGIGIFDGKSFPLVDWVGPTRIEGLTQEPFELKGHFSRAYDSNRHIFLEVFLLTPTLDPTVSENILAELKENNIPALIISQWTADSRSEPNMYLWGFDDQIRPLD